MRSSARSGIVFEHADGGAYGSKRVAKRAQVLATVLQLLVGQGDEEREAQAMNDRVAAHVGSNADVTEVSRAALRGAPLPPGCREERAVYLRLAG